LTNDATLSAERVLTAGSGIEFADAGANSTLTVAGKDATTAAKGVASFSSDNFSVTSGAVTIKDGGVAPAELASADFGFFTVTAGTATLDTDVVNDTHIDWGTGAGQVSLDDVPDGSSYQKVAAADVDASGHINVLTDIDGTGAITITGPTATRAKTISDAADTIAELGAANTFTGNNVFGDGDTDTLTIRSLVVGGNSRSVWIAGSAPTPTYATGTNELYVAGDVESGGVIYGSGFVSTASGGESYIDVASNATSPSGAGANSLYVVSNAWKIKENGTEKDIPTPTDSVTWTGTTHSFAGVTNLVLPTAAPDAAGEIGINTTNNQLIYHDGAAVIKIDTTGIADGKLLKYSSANSQFEVADDATAGSPTLNSIGNPSGDTTIAMDAGEEVNFQYTGNYTTGSQFLIQQLTGNPSGGVLFEVRSADSDTVNSRFGDGTNYLQISQAGNVSHGGTSVFTAPRVATSIAPSANDGATLGTTALQFSDLFLATGGVINWNNGASTLTHSANTLTIGGSGATTLALGSNNITTTTGQVRVGDAATYLYQPADGYVGLIGDTGVRLTANDEDLQLTKTGANGITIGSSSGVTDVTTALNLVATGQISGRIPVVADADGKTLSGTDLYGSMQMATGAGTWVIPDVDAAAGTGQAFCVYVTGAYEVVIDGNAEDKIRLNGTLGAAGGNITNATAEAAGDYVCLVLTDFDSDVAHWTVLGKVGTWTVP
jgi:hypothetical protein